MDNKNRIEELTKEQRRISQRIKKRREQNQADTDRFHQVTNEIHRLQIKQLVDVSNGVVMRSRYPSDMRESKLNDILGTLITVGRTKGTVNFGAAGKWKIRLSELLPVEERNRQGEFICL